MNSMTLKCLGLVLAFLVAACSDDDLKKDMGGAGDKGVDQPRADAMAVDTSAPDQAMADTTSPDATAGHDSMPAGDGGALAASCAALIKNCPTSLTWPQYIKPFTSSNCVTVVSCVDKLYTGTCATKFKELVARIDTITAASQCDSKCASQIGYLTTNCACPSACGVACP